jgi:hypothetical protein
LIERISFSQSIFGVVGLFYLCSSPKAVILSTIPATQKTSLSKKCLIQVGLFHPICPSKTVINLPFEVSDRFISENDPIVCSGTLQLSLMLKASLDNQEL